MSAMKTTTPRSDRGGAPRRGMRAEMDV
jgi:hypothetical protein